MTPADSTAALALVEAHTAHFDELANLPFAEGRPTMETAQILRDELLFQRATQTYLWALPLMNTLDERSTKNNSPRCRQDQTPGTASRER
jgi:hypothetical protein